ncbi:MAG TPA: hypothetical protein VK961_24295 [Chthoniobacter sp.]|nr:hypothetical protein [Chthoniobacter sp.]
MKKTILTLSIAALLIAPGLHAEDLKYPPINPALLYWQAAAQLPQLTEDQSNELREMATGKEPFDAARAAKLPLDNGSMRVLRQAADSTAPCDWGLPLEDGPVMPLPHLAKLQQMSSMAIVKAKSLFAQDKVQEGMSWLVVAHCMARHAGAGDLLISHLVQDAIEVNALRAAALHCLGWNTETRHGYAAMLESLPPLHTAQDGLRGERLFVDWVERHFNAGGKSNAEVQAIIASLTAEKGAEKENVEAQFAPGAMAATLTEWRSLQSRLEAAFGKPWTEGQAEIKALTDEAIHSPHPLPRLAFPTTTGVFEKWFTVATLHTMLEAALEHGPQLDEASAGTYRDALEGEPLRLKKSDNGTLTLVATHPHPAGKEISLQLGK